MSQDDNKMDLTELLAGVVDPSGLSATSAFPYAGAWRSLKSYMSAADTHDSAHRATLCVAFDELRDRVLACMEEGSWVPDGVACLAEMREYERKYLCECPRSPELLRMQSLSLEDRIAAALLERTNAGEVEHYFQLPPEGCEDDDDSIEAPDDVYDLQDWLAQQEPAGCTYVYGQVSRTAWGTVPYKHLYDVLLQETYDIREQLWDLQRGVMPGAIRLLQAQAAVTHLLGGRDPATRERYCQALWAALQLRSPGETLDLKGTIAEMDSLVRRAELAAEKAGLAYCPPEHRRPRIERIVWNLLDHTAEAQAANGES